MSDPSESAISEELAATRAELARITTELARMTAELAARSAEAAAAGRTRSEFLATMSHELRTPINAVLGYAQLLDMGVLGPATPEQQAHLARLQASARHLLRLVDDVLDIAKADADRIQVRRDTLVTGAAVSAAVALVQPEATARGIRLIDAGADSLGFAYVGDEHRVRQILVNILSNAVKFTPSGGTITVECGLAAVDGDDASDAPDIQTPSHSTWAMISVRDTGPGIAGEMRDRIFEPFVQGETGLTREAGGTGLGLAISRRLARLMGGDITVRSAPKRGATFTIWLPAPGGGAVTRPPEPAKRRTPVLGVPIAANAGLSTAAYDVVRAMGTRLSTDTEAIAMRYVAAVRADPSFPGGTTIATAQIRDHITTLVSQFAAQLTTIGEMHGRAPELLADGGQVQRLMAELHGVQRHRLGWSESDVAREMLIVVTEVQLALRRALEAPPVALPDTGDVDESARTLALDYALDLARHVIERAQQVSLRSFRFAVASEEH